MRRCPRQPRRAGAQTAPRRRSSATPRRTPARDPRRRHAEFAASRPGRRARRPHRGARRRNKRMLYYYFGNKEALFLAVLEDTYAGIRDAEKRVAPARRSRRPRRIRRLVAFTWDYYLAHPEFIALLNSENLHARRAPEAVARTCRAMNSPLIETLAHDRAGPRQRRRRVPTRRRPAAALHLDRRAVVLLPVATSHTLSTVFGARPRHTAIACRAPCAHGRLCWATCDLTPQARLRARDLARRRGRRLTGPACAAIINQPVTSNRRQPSHHAQRAARGPTR